jgi:hypothetical protein
VVELATREARTAGLEDPRVTTDGKFVEIGVTDKSDVTPLANGNVVGMWHRTGARGHRW